MAFAVPDLTGQPATAQNGNSAALHTDSSGVTRERLSINANWRFHRGDPEGEASSLLYDVRPDVKDEKDDKAADSKPTEAEKVSVSQTVLKPWILPTGNAFLKDPARRFVRPLGDPGSNASYVQGSFDDHAWSQVNLPHDWAIAGPFITNGPGGGMGRLPNQGIGWYRKKLDIPASDAGKSIFLDVDGAMSYAMVWLNGHLVGGWPYGYSSWRVDLTPYIVPGGENQLVIRLDNPPSSSRWYPGGGIYRNVWLTKTQSLHVAQWGTYITTSEVSKTSATIHVEVTLDNDAQTSSRASITTQIYALDERGHRSGGVLATIAPLETEVAAGENARVKGSVRLSNPRLWGPPPTQQPHLYLAVTAVSQQGKPIDQYETRFGIRELRFDPNRGISVNGEPIRVQGVNQHHDLGALGAAFNVRAARRQLEILREMGCNAVRMSHNPPAPELLELTDLMGFLVIDESFDMWQRKKTPLDFHLIYDDWHEQDMRALVRRDRNCPSVIMWSVGNEVGEQYTGEEGAAVAKKLCDIVREEDATRPTTSAMNFAKSDMPMPGFLDVISLNYQGEGIRFGPAYRGLQGIITPPQYPAFHARFPDKMIISSETASALSSRGEYLFPVTSENTSPIRDGVGGDPQSHQVSAYELYSSDFGASADWVFASLDQHPYVAGEFVWSGFDYLGEPTPYYTSRSSYSGIIDLAGFPKDRYYLYQSRWRPDLPLAHILPHWNWPDRVGQVTPVHVFTSGDEAELFLNGRSLGRKQKGQYEYRLRWDDVKYEPGELKVVAYKGGKKWAEESVHTTGGPARIVLKADRTSINADGRDLSFVTVSLTDEKGRIVPQAKNHLKFSVSGPGEIIATDNGDPTSFEPFTAPERDAFNGLCLVIIRSLPGQSGKIELRAESPSLRGASLALKTVQSP